MDENDRYTDPPKWVPSVATAFGLCITFVILGLAFFAAFVDIMSMPTHMN